MRRVVVSQPKSDCVTVEVGRDWRRAGFLTLALGLVSGLMVLPPAGSWAGWAALVLGAMTLVPVAVLLGRSLKRSSHTLVRGPGRLLLDGDPLELARVELRVTQVPFLKVPTGYALSLWVMTSVGPDEVPLGHWRTLLEASALAGQLEEFLAKGNHKQQRHLS